MANVRFHSVTVAAVLAGVLFGPFGGSLVGPASAADLPEPPVGGPGRDGEYLRLIHGRIHPTWVDGFIRISPYKQLGASTSDRHAEVSFTIRWDGTIESVDVSRASGSDDFDAAALNAIKSAAPFPPPVDVLGDDGLAHVKWVFARNHRLCAGGQIVPVEYPLRIALPNLTQRGQLSEAVRRMSDELARQGWAGGELLTTFVRDWLGRPNLSNELDTRAAAALALGGDRRQIRYLETALLLPVTAALAAPALERLGVDVGDRLAKAMVSHGDPSPATRRAVLAALRATPAAAASCPSCVEVLAAFALDPRQPAATRVELIKILGSLDSTPVVAQTLSQASKDTQTAVRGAALLASLTPGRGRPGVVQMAPLLRNASADIRAAGAAGVLRAGGDLGIEQLYGLGREKDPRPLIAAAAELGRLSSPASAALLGKLLKRADKTVRLAAIRALAQRSDAPARTLVDPVLAAARTDATEEPGVRELAIAAATPGELVAMSTDVRLGSGPYRALLRANLRPEAARWLLANIEQLAAEDRITALGDWIAEPPKYAAAKQ